MEWEILLAIFSWFRSQPALRQISVTLVTVMLLAGAWRYDYSQRIEVKMRDMSYEYERNIEVRADCDASERHKRLYDNDCKRAARITNRTLYETAREVVWAESHLCGAHTCADWFFGVDSTVIGIGARLLIVFGIGALTILVFDIARKSAVIVDTFVKRMETEKHSRAMRLHREKHAVRELS